MYIQQLYTNCLAEAAYYIESEGEAAVIDPMREPEPYLALAKERGATICYIFETHFHADFISGHLEVAALTQAPIVFGPGADTLYPVYKARDEEIFKLGAVSFKVLHTPGHTPESSCYLLLDEKNLPHAIFTGDTLFVGDVGRPDLLDGRMTSQELAGLMYDSLNTKIKTLPDEVLVYPAHGPGSACGKNIGKEKSSTIGEQKKNNYALQNIDKQHFIQQLCEGIMPPPAYFFADTEINKNGYNLLYTVIHKNLQPLSLTEFKEKARQEDVVILDTRAAHEFEEGFIPNSLNVGLDGQYAVWVGTLVDIHKPLLLVCEPGKEEEAITRLARVGFENVIGYLQGGFPAWQAAHEQMDEVDSVEADQLRRLMEENPEAIVLDVRKASEYADAHIVGCTHIPLADIPARKHDFEPDKQYIVYCGGGYRSMIAVSLLKIFGVDKLTNVHGGFGAIKNSEGVSISAGARAMIG
jgi:hydroxyacylglutathione hydrolase